MTDEAFFGTDGIRDRFGEGRLSAGNLVRIGRAIGGFARARRATAPRVFIGRDTRPSGPALLAGIASGIAAEGVVVEDGGVLPTPAIAWQSARGDSDLAVALTASHNPVEDNGVKVFLPGGRKTGPEEEEDLERRIRAASPAAPPAPVQARPDALEDYVAAATSLLGPRGRLDGVRLVVDGANGATMTTAPRVLAALGAEVMSVSGLDPNGVINRDCGTQYPAAWLRGVRVEGAFGGLAFDGDGDRVLVADETGEILDGDAILHLLALDMNSRGRLSPPTVVATVMSNFGLEVALHRAGIGLERVPVGDRHVAARMREGGFRIGGEQSGHVVLWWDGALVGDGLVAGVLAIEAARRRNLSLSACRAEVPRFPQVLENVRVARRIPLEEAPVFLALVKAEEAALVGKGRVVVRYSGTEPLLRIMVEAADDATVKAAVGRLVEEAKRIR